MPPALIPTAGAQTYRITQRRVSPLEGGSCRKKCRLSTCRLKFHLLQSVHFMCIFLGLLASSKVLESVVEGEEKEINSSDESTKPLTKEEEMTDLRMETPELKVNLMRETIH